MLARPGIGQIELAACRATHEKGITASTTFANKIADARATLRADYCTRRGAIWLCTIGRQRGQTFSGEGVIRIDGENVFQAGTLVLETVGQCAEPQPGEFVILVKLDDVKQQIISLYALTGLGERICDRASSGAGGYAAIRETTLPTSSL
ncbi:MAG: hypothetical protein P8186_16135 [Anaerolineae bacterium]